MLNQYLMAVHNVEGQPLPSPDVMQKMYADVDALNKVMMNEGAWVFGGGLHPVSSATVVRQKNGEILLTDGPFSEAKEQIGGFWVIKCKDLDAALKWAAKATVACGAPVEVRPFQEQVE
jgi:hypothetical protein